MVDGTIKPLCSQLNSKHEWIFTPSAMTKIYAPKVERRYAITDGKPPDVMHAMANISKASYLGFRARFACVIESHWKKCYHVANDFK